MIRRLVFIGILFIGIGIALLQIPAVGTLARAMLASAAIIAGVIGIAARAPIANLVSGIMIAFSQPVRLNDYISVDGEFGTVEQISLIYTYIRSDDGRRVVIPNEAFAMKAVHNYSMGSPGSMVGIDLSLPLDADVERIAQAMLEVGESLAPAPVGKQDSVEVADISGGGVTLRLHAWAADPLRRREVASDLRAALLRRLTGDGLSAGRGPVEATDVPGGCEDAGRRRGGRGRDGRRAADDGAAASAGGAASSVEGRRPLAWALAAAVGSRVLIFAVAFAAAASIGIGGLPVGWRFPLRAEVFSGWLGSLFNPWAHWDGVWYIKIATSGYAEADGSTAFFPLFPMLLRYAGVLLDGNLLITGIVISLLCYAGLRMAPLPAGATGLRREGRRPRRDLPRHRAALVLPAGGLHGVPVPAPLARLLRVRPRGPLAVRGRHGPARDAHPQHRRAPAHPDDLLLL